MQAVAQSLAQAGAQGGSGAQASAQAIAQAASQGGTAANAAAEAIAQAAAQVRQTRTLWPVGGSPNTSRWSVVAPFCTALFNCGPNNSDAITRSMHMLLACHSSGGASHTRLCFREA